MIFKQILKHNNRKYGWSPSRNMKLPLFIAFRYLRSPKSHSVINLISWVAGIAIVIPTAALVIILSFHNGLTDTIQSLYNSFDPEIRITPTTGKYFSPLSINLSSLSEIEAKSHIIEDNILVKHGEREHLATLRGVDESFNRVTDIEQLITHGKYQPRLGELDQAVIGYSIAYRLGINPSLFQKLQLFSMRPDNVRSIFPTPIYRSREISPVGVFSLDEEANNKYVISSLRFAQDIFGHQGEVTSIELRLKEGVNLEKAKHAIQQQVGSEFRVESRFEQKASIYRAINQEKWVIYILLMMVLLIASLSLAGSIIILITDKRSQIKSLYGIGATTGLIRSIFRYNGMLIVLFGSFTGALLGTIFALLQQHYGIIEMIGSNLIINSYPAKLLISDILFIIAGVCTIGWIISAITVRTTIRS